MQKLYCTCIGYIVKHVTKTSSKLKYNHCRYNKANNWIQHALPVQLNFSLHAFFFWSTLLGLVFMWTVCFIDPFTGVWDLQLIVSSERSSRDTTCWFATAFWREGKWSYKIRIQSKPRGVVSKHNTGYTTTATFLRTSRGPKILID